MNFGGIELSRGQIYRMFHEGATDAGSIVQVLELRRIQANTNGQQQNQQNQQPPSPDRYRMTISDGVHYQQAMLATQLNNFVQEAALTKGSVIRLLDCICNTVHNRRIVIILNLEVVSQPIPVIGDPQNVEGPNAPQLSQPGFSAPQQSANIPAPVMSSSAPQMQQLRPTNPRAPPATSYQGQQRPSPQIQSRPPQQQAFRPQQFGQQQHHQQQPNQPNMSQIHPIKALNPYNTRWTIKARVTFKSKIRTFNNAAKGTNGKLFSIDLVDAEGGEIRATMFNDAVDKWEPFFQVDKAYYISRGTLKTANRKFSSIKNEYELTLDVNAMVLPCEDESDIPALQFNIVPIREIETCARDAIIDVCGCVMQVSDLQTVTTKSEKELIKRTVTLLDSSNASIELTLWANEAEHLPWDPSDPKLVVLIVKGAKVSHFAHRSLTTVSSSQIHVNPDVKEVRQLIGWYQSNARDVPPAVMTDATKVTVKERKHFADIKEDQLAFDKGSSFRIKGTISLIRRETFTFNACPIEECGKKIVFLTEQNCWQCTKCLQLAAAPRLKYALTFQASDHTGSCRLSAFDGAAQELLYKNEAQQLHDNVDLMDYVFTDLTFRQRIFQVRASLSQQNDVPRPRCVIFKAEELNWVNESQYLINQIAQLL